MGAGRFRVFLWVGGGGGVGVGLGGVVGQGGVGRGAVGGLVTARLPVFMFLLFSRLRRWGVWGGVGGGK